MSSPRIEHVFYNAHSKVARCVLRRTSHRLRSLVEHAVLVLAVCGFCVVILSHRTFVHREDVDGAAAAAAAASAAAGCYHAADDAEAGGRYLRDGESSSDAGGIFGIGEGQRAVSAYSIVVQLVRAGHSWMVPTRNPLTGTGGKKIPGHCLRSIPGFREDADVNHILLRYDDYGGHDDEDGGGPMDSRAFTINRGKDDGEIIVSGMPTDSTQRQHSCVIGGDDAPQSAGHRTALFGFGREQVQKSPRECPPEVSSFLAHHGHLPPRRDGSTTMECRQHFGGESSSAAAERRRHSPIIYSYSHSQGLLRLDPALQRAHDVSTQFVVASSSDPRCFGDGFAREVVFRLVGPDTVALNWILGLQGLQRAGIGGGGGGGATGGRSPRYVYHWNTRKEMDLDVYDGDHYAFSSGASGGGRRGGSSSGGAYESVPGTPSSKSSPSSPLTERFGAIAARARRYPLYRFLRFLAFKVLVLLSTLLIFFLTTSLVSFTFQETQDRMLEFTLQLQARVRARAPLGGLIVGHVLENLVFVPIMVGMIFFLIEFYGGDKFLAFAVLSTVWICEVFSAISIRSAQGMHFFPRVFFLYFTLFHVYFFSCPIGFTYASLASTVLFMFHTMLFFLNRYELPALHAGLITPQSPRMARLEMVGGRGGGEPDAAIASPPRIQPSSAPMPRIHEARLPQMPQVSSLDNRSTVTATTAPLSSLNDFTPRSDQQSLLPPAHPGPMRSYVAAASSSLQSIRSLASIQSSASLAAERTTSPNFIFLGSNTFNDSGDAGEGEEDSYIARVMSS